jgi:hypothetical protein
MNNSAFLQFHDYEDIDRLKKPIVGNGKIASPNIAHVILDKSGPILGKGRRFSYQANIFLDGSFAQGNAQFQEFTSDSLRAPKRVFLDQSTDYPYRFRGYSLLFFFDWKYIANTSGTNLYASARAYPVG